jgi:PKD repeat protein
MDSELSFEGFGNDTASDRAFLRYRWDFGDGRSSDWSAEPGSAHTYTAPGRFVAAFFVLDGDGATARSAVNVTVRNVPPSCTVSAPRPGATFQKDEPVELDGGGADTATDRPRLQYSWNFGDGDTGGWGPSPKASHTYRKGGNFTAVLSTRDPAGTVTSSSVRFSVLNQPPAVRITAPAGGDFDEDAPVTFRAEGRDTASDAPSLTYSWLIDGRTRPGQTVEAAFTTEGPHDFTVTVTDPEGATATATGTVLIGNPAPVLTASLEPASIMLYEAVRFTASAEDTASDVGALSFSWDFGDGGSSSERSGSHVYRQAGTFTVKVTVRDDEGARDTLTFPVRVDGPAVKPPPGGGDDAGPASPLAQATALAMTGALLVAALAGAALLWRRRRRAA